MGSRGKCHKVSFSILIKLAKFRIKIAQSDNLRGIFCPRLCRVAQNVDIFAQVDGKKFVESAPKKETEGNARDSKPEMNLL